MLQTYVYFEDKCYFVSTIDRESSSMYGGRYAETMVWEIDLKMGDKLPGILHQDEAWEGETKTHNYVCDMIFKRGAYWEEKDERS